MTAALPRRDLALGGLLAGIYLALLAATLDIGFPRDESFYFNAGEQYARWFDVLAESPSRAFTRAEVDRAFAYNAEHPALPKILFGLSWRLFGKMHDPQAEPWSRSWYHQSAPPDPILGWLSESTAMRLPALVTNSFLVFLLYVFAARYLNRRVALAATIGWMLTPHAFWHAHLACFDVPMVVMTFATAYCFYRSVTLGPPPPGRARARGAWGWAIATAVVWGLALNTKHNAFFLPITFVAWWAWTNRRAFRLSFSGGLRIPEIPLAFLAMLVVSPVVYWALWPKLWFDPIAHLKFYFGFHAKHDFYWAYYWGTLHTKPPFPVAFPFVMSAMTLSGPVALLAVAGLGRTAWQALSGIGAARRRPVAAVAADAPAGRAPGLTSFLLLNFLVPFAVIAHPSTPIFGGTKHWMPGVPFLMIFAGIAFDRILSALDDLGTRHAAGRGRALRGLLALAVAAAFVVPAARDTLRGHTNGSTFYNAFFGGFGAMGQHRMQREFWGNTAFSALPWLNANAPHRARVDFHDTTWDAVRHYWRDGLLRRDIQPVWDHKRADVFLFHWHKEFLDLEADARTALGNPVPAHVVAEDGVPLLNAYARPPRPAPAPRTARPPGRPRVVPAATPDPIPATAPPAPADESPAPVAAPADGAQAPAPQEVSP